MQHIITVGCNNCGCAATIPAVEVFDALRRHASELWQIGYNADEFLALIKKTEQALSDERLTKKTPADV